MERGKGENLNVLSFLLLILSYLSFCLVQFTLYMSVCCMYVSLSVLVILFSRHFGRGRRKFPY